VELAARYFYATTGRTPPRANGSLYARDVTNVDPQLNLSPSTDIYQSTLKTGDIISMGLTNTYGHVAIVISVEPSVLSGGNGTISVLNENAYTTGIDKITVTNGAMTYEGLYNIFQWAFGIPTPDFNGPTPPAPAPPPSAPVGPFAYRIVLPGTGPNATVNERAGAGTSFVIVGRLPEASIIEISCQTSGTLVNTSTVWDQLSNGDYVSDYFTNTPAKNGFSSNIPRCASGSTTTTTPPPTMTVTSPNFSVGPDSACLVTTSGMVECWGDNDQGQLGDGSTTNSSTPVTVPDLKTVKEVSVGAGSACALLDDGTVTCWGGLASFNGKPVTVSGLNGVTQVSVGGNTDCALLLGGTVKCWGLNYQGQLGNGSTVDQSTAPVTVSGLNGVVEISSSELYECALLGNGGVDCWGDGAFGELGDGSTSNSNVPVAVSSLAGATQVSAGLTGPCAIVVGGSVDCWGSNLGIANYQTGNILSDVPVPFSQITGASEVAANGVDSCVLLVGQTVECWGVNTDGELGVGTTNSSQSAESVSSLTGVTAIGEGQEESCASLSSGAVYCWGNNQYGELGNGAFSNSSVPVQVSGT